MKTPRTTTPTDPDPQRIAKVIARAGLCSRREAEAWIAAGRVAINGRTLETPAVTVKPGDEVAVDGQPLPQRDRTRLWQFHKPKGLVTTTHDPEGRATVFDVLPKELPRVMSVGRLDINTEGLLLLTNDGGLARVMELPSTGWLRRYRVRAHGDIDQARLDALRDGIAVDGILYGAIEATLDRKQGDNVWLTMGLREGKNREVKNILMHLGLDVNRLIRLSFGPFQLGDLAEGAVAEVPRRHLLDQLGETLASAAGADFDVREDDRKPKMPRPPARPEPLERGPAPARRARPDAARSRRRHEADVDHNAGPAAPPPRPRPVLGLKGGAPRADRARDGTADPAPPRGQKSRRDVTETRRAGAARAEAVVERKPRRPRDPEPEAPRRGRASTRPSARPDREGDRPAGRATGRPERSNDRPARAERPVARGRTPVGADTRPPRAGAAGFGSPGRRDTAPAGRPGREDRGERTPIRDRAPGGKAGGERAPGRRTRREDEPVRSGGKPGGRAPAGGGPGAERTGSDSPRRGGKPGFDPRADGKPRGRFGRGGDESRGGGPADKPRGRPGADSKPGGKTVGEGKPRGAGPGGRSAPDPRSGGKPRGAGGKPGGRPAGPGGRGADRRR